MMKNPTDVSAVAFAPRLMVNEPPAGTTFLMYAVASFVRTVANTIEFTVQSELVTTSAEAPIAKLTVPLGLSIVRGPVVPAAVLVARYVTFPSLSIRYIVAGVAAPSSTISVPTVAVVFAPRT